jgi:hypothetical protein
MQSTSQLHVADKFRYVLQMTPYIPSSHMLMAKYVAKQAQPLRLCFSTHRYQRRSNDQDSPPQIIRTHADYVESKNILLTDYMRSHHKKVFHKH